MCIYRFLITVYSILWNTIVFVTLLNSISYHDINVMILQSNKCCFYEFIIEYGPDCTQPPLSHECMSTK